jgi:hypothetical protein
MSRSKRGAWLHAHGIIKREKQEATDVERASRVYPEEEAWTKDCGRAWDETNFK